MHILYLKGNKPIFRPMEVTGRIQIALIALALSGTSIIAYCQENIFREIKKIQIGNFKNGSCLEFIHQDDLPTFEISHLQQVIIIRHGEPALNKKGCKNRQEAIRFTEMYDSVGVYDFEEKPICLSETEVNVVYTSKLPRAINTAEKTVAEAVPMESYKFFNEFERKVMCFPNVKMPRRFWSITSGFLWILGCNHKGIETFTEAKNRSKRAAFFLDDKAENHGKAVLFSHGFLNRFINRYMKKLGYKSLNLNGKKYLGAYYFYKINTGR